MTGLSCASQVVILQFGMIADRDKSPFNERGEIAFPNDRRFARDRSAVVAGTFSNTFTQFCNCRRHTVLIVVENLTDVEHKAR